MKKLLMIALMSMPIIAMTADEMVSSEKRQEELVHKFFAIRLASPNTDDVNRLVDLNSDEAVLFKYNDKCHVGSGDDLRMLRDIQSGKYFEKTSRLAEKSTTAVKELKKFSDDHAIAPISAELYLRLLGQYSSQLMSLLTKKVAFRKAYAEGAKVVIAECLEAHKNKNIGDGSNNDADADAESRNLNPLSAMLLASMLAREDGSMGMFPPHLLLGLGLFGGLDND